MPDHRYFDSGFFAIVPKVSPPGTMPRYVTHILSREASDIWSNRHTAIVQHMGKRCSEYLFARFAWTILLGIKNFVTSNHHRQVIQFRVVGEDQYEYANERMSGQGLKVKYGGGGSTPRSRNRSVGDDYDIDDIDDIDMERGNSGLYNVSSPLQHRGVALLSDAGDPSELAEGV